MGSTKRSWKLLAIPLLVATVLVTAPDVLCARDGTSTPRSLEAERARAELSRRLAREEAHARMPNTMYASTARCAVRRS